MKYLGIDFGTKRIGIATSDEAGEFAFPKGIIGAGNAEEEIAARCAGESIGAIVVGQSIATNEAENEVQAAVARFAQRIGALTALPVYFEREDFSSVEAHRYQTGAGVRDDSAAAVILQRFLDKQKK